MKKNNILKEDEITPQEQFMISFSFDYIRHNPDMTNERLPDLLLQFWQVPDFSVFMENRRVRPQYFIMLFIINSEFNSFEKTEQVFQSLQFHLLFYRFQVILAATAWCRKHQLPIKPFPIFDISKYSMPDLNDPDLLMKEYNRIVEPNQ